MKGITWIFIILVGGYTFCYWDYHLSNYLFKRYCNEEGRTGQFIYERVALEDDYFMPIPKDKVELRRVDSSFFIDERRSLIDKHKLMQDFNISRQNKTVITSIGPILSYEKSIVRKSDEKVLSKSISLLNKKGWLSRKSILGTTVGDTCSKYKHITGLVVTKSEHSDLLGNTFYKY